MVSMFILYRPSRLFVALAALTGTVAFTLAARFIYLVYLIPDPDPQRTYLPSLLVMTVFALVTFLLLVVSVLAELSRSQRRLTEEVLYQSRIAARKT